MKSLIDANTLGSADMLALMNLALALKACVKADYFPPLLRNRTVAIVAPDAASMQRAAFRLAALQLGAQPLFYDLPFTEANLRPLAALLSRTADLAVIRAPRHELFAAFARLTDMPLLNGDSSYCRPVQELADLITMYEHLPKEKRLESCRLVYLGADSPYAASALFSASRVGMGFVQCADKAGQLKPPQLKCAEENVRKSGGVYSVTEDGAEALRDADFIIAPESPHTPRSDGVVYIDPEENLLPALRALYTALLYRDPQLRDPVLIEKLRRTLTGKLQMMFGFGETGD